MTNSGIIIRSNDAPNGNDAPIALKMIDLAETLGNPIGTNVKLFSLAVTNVPAAGAPPPAVATETAGGGQASNGATITAPTNAVSVAVAGSFDLSFNGGTTYPIVGFVGSLSFGEGTTSIIANSAQMVARAAIGGTVTMIYEVQ